MEILDTSVLVKQIEENDDDASTTCNDTVQNSNRKSISLAHRNLSRKKCLLAIDSISEVHYNTSELVAQTCSDNIPDGKTYGSKKSHNIVDVEECDHEQSAGNLCNNNINVASDKHKLNETISLHICKQFLKNDDSATNHGILVNILLKTSSDDDKDCNVDHDSNFLTNESTSLSIDMSKETLSSQSITSANHSEATNNTKVSLNPLNNNSKDSFKNMICGSELFLSEHVCKEISMSQDTGCVSSCYNDSANTSKPFKLPILEKMPKTASVQPSEIEENAVALLDSSFTRQNQLEEVRCLDLEPRSSNSSEESNSDVESQHASTSNNDKKVSDRIFCLFQKNINTFYC